MKYSESAQFEIGVLTNAHAAGTKRIAELEGELQKLYEGLRSIANRRSCPVDINNAIIMLTDNTAEILNSKQK